MVFTQRVTDGAPSANQGSCHAQRPQTKCARLIQVKATDLPFTIGEQVWVRDQNRKGQIIGATKLRRSYLVKTDMSTLRRNRSALVPTSSKPAFPSDGLTMTPRNQALPVDQTPPKVSIHVRENLPAEPSTPARSTAASTQEGHPNTGNSLMERVTRSGRVVKPPKRLDL